MVPKSMEACTRVLFVGDDETVVTARSLDWGEYAGAALWKFPRGMTRQGMAGDNSIEWTARHGSVIVSFYGKVGIDGMNEAGLVANVLYLAETDYGELDGKPGLSVSLWSQYVLDNFTTVEEAVNALREEPFRIMAPTLPNGSPAAGHLAISDPTGDSAIFEYLDGQLHIHHGREYEVMTNSPPFDQQLALDAYWKQIGQDAFLPGTARASDRFVRASALLDALPKSIDKNIIKAVPGQDLNTQSVASMLSLIRAVSVPLGTSTPGQPNIASTFWRSVSDHANRRYYYDSATSPHTFWVELDDLDFEESAPSQTLPVGADDIYSGNVAAQFEEAEPFQWLSGDGK